MQALSPKPALTQEIEFILHDQVDGRTKAYNHIRTEIGRKRRIRRLQIAHKLKAGSIMALGPLPWKSSYQAKSEAANRISGQPIQKGSVESSIPPRNRRSEDDNSDYMTMADTNTVVQRAETSDLEGSSKPSTARQPESAEDNESLTAMIKSRQPDPFTLLSAARRDPFRSYPIPTYPGLDDLVDFYARGLGPYLYGYTPNGENDIFAHRGLPISLSDPAAFHANMLMASISMDRISGHSLSGVRALRHRIEAIRLINEKLADPADCVSAGTIYTVTVLTCLEHNWGAVGSHEERLLLLVTYDADVRIVHAAGLQNILIKRGGLQTLHHYPMLEHTIYSIALNTPRLLSFGSPAIYSANQPHFSPSEERRALCSEFLYFLSNTSSLSTQRSPVLFAFSQSAFRPSSPILKLLSSPPAPRPGFSSDQAIANEERGRLSISLHMHCTIIALHHRHHLPRQQQQPAASLATSLAWHKQHFRWLLAREWIWRDSPSMLRYLLVKEEDSARLHDPETGWKVLRLTSVTAWLRREMFVWVMRFMLCILCQDREVQGLLDEAPAKIEQIKEELEKYCRQKDFNAEILGRDTYGTEMGRRRDSATIPPIQTRTRHFTLRPLTPTVREQNH